MLIQMYLNMTWFFLDYLILCIYFTLEHILNPWRDSSFNSITLRPIVIFSSNFRLYSFVINASSHWIFEIVFRWEICSRVNTRLALWPMLFTVQFMFSLLCCSSSTAIANLHSNYSTGHTVLRTRSQFGVRALITSYRMFEWFFCREEEINVRFVQYS